MKYSNFEDMVITTITAVTKHDSIVSRELAFTLMPTVDLPLYAGEIKKKLEKSGKPGTVISCSYNGSRRGIPINPDAEYLKNSVEAYMSLENKNVNLKFSMQKIQMVGLKSFDQADDINNYIIKHLSWAQEELNHMRSFPNKEELKDRFLCLMKGKDCLRPIYETRKLIFEDTSLSTQRVPRNILDHMDDDDKIIVYRNNVDINSRDSDEVQKENSNTPNTEFMTKKELVSLYARKFKAKMNNGYVSFFYQIEVEQVEDFEAVFDIPVLDNDDIKNNIPLEMTEGMNNIVSKSAPNIMRQEDNDKANAVPPGKKHISLNPKITVAEGGFPYRVYWFLRNAVSNFEYYSDIEAVINWIFEVEDDIYDKPLEIQAVDKVMVNYNYDLGFRARRAELCKIINGQDGFRCTWDNLAHTTIMIKYFLEDGRKVNIMVYSSGKVTQSGRTEEVNRMVYEKFMKLVSKNYERIVSYQPREYKIIPVIA